MDPVRYVNKPTVWVNSLRFSFPQMVIPAKVDLMPLLVGK